MTRPDQRAPMLLSYVDTSAAMKLLFDEPETDALRSSLGRGIDRILVASQLLHTELHCAAGRRTGVTPDTLSTVLGMITLVDLTSEDLIAAGARAPLRSQDAIHLATAIRLGADEMITYDHELSDAAIRAGIRSVSPGA